MFLFISKWNEFHIPECFPWLWKIRNTSQWHKHEPSQSFLPCTCNGTTVTFSHFWPIQIQGGVAGTVVPQATVHSPAPLHHSTKMLKNHPPQSQPAYYRVNFYMPPPAICVLGPPFDVSIHHVHRTFLWLLYLQTTIRLRILCSRFFNFRDFEIKF